MPPRPLNGALCHIKWPGILFPAKSYLFEQNSLSRKKGAKAGGWGWGGLGIDEVVSKQAAVEWSPVADCYSSQLAASAAFPTPAPLHSKVSIVVMFWSRTKEWSKSKTINFLELACIACSRFQVQLPVTARTMRPKWRKKACKLNCENSTWTWGYLGVMLHAV